MLNINCLLQNTSLKEDLKNMIEYMGYDRMANKRDPSLGGIYADLQKAGVEIDIRTVGELYKLKLSHQSERFTQPKEVDKITGRDTEITIRNLMLQKPLEGEQKIGKMPPEEFIANGLMRTFRSNIVEDTRTKSIMRTLQDAAHAQARRMVGELPVEKGNVPAEHWEDTIKNALELDNKGYNTLEGTLNNAHTLFEGMRKEIARHSETIRGTHDDVLRGQWNDYIDSLENATYSLLLSREQAKNIMHGALKDAGYKKEMKGGKTELDWNALAGNISDVGTLRRTVRSVLEEKGYSAGTASRIADALQKEFHEMRGTMIARAQRESQALQESWDKMTPAEKKSFDLNDMINKRLIAWDNYKQLSGDTGKKIEFTKGEGMKIISDALKSEGLGKEVKGGKSVFDWTKMAGELKTPADVQAKVESFLQKKGYPSDLASQISEAIQKKYVEVRQNILDHSKQKLDSLQDYALNPIPPVKKTDLQRLGEYHDMGIFEGDHDAFLNHVVGIDQPTIQDMQELNDIGRMSAELSRELDGDNYLAAPVFQEFQRQVNAIIGRNIGNKTRALRLMTAISHYFQLQNMGIIGNAFNMMENNLSGFKEMLSANLDLIGKVGLRAAFKDGRLLKATWKNISAGGIEYGDDTGKFGAHNFVADKFNVSDINKSTLQDPKKYGKVLATLAIAPAKAYLNGSDGAFKAAIHKKTMKLALHKALIDRGIEKGEAAQMINEALYGQSMDDARAQASDMLNRYGQKNTKASVERLANNLVIQNLNADTRISKDMVEAAYKSSYNVASLGMGHTANNIVSKRLLAGKAKAASEEKTMIRNEDWGPLAYHRLKTSIVYNGLLRFMGGAANWGWLRLQSGLGLGYVTGYLGKFRNESELNFDDPEKLQHSMHDYLKSQREISRATVGMGWLALNVAMMYAYGAARKKGDDEDTDEGALASAYKGIQKNYVLNKILSKAGADAILLHYLASTSTSNHGNIDASIKYVQNNFNIGNLQSPASVVLEAGQDIRHGEKGYGRTAGNVAQIAGSLTEFPFYKSYKQAGMLINYGVTGKDPKPTYKQPYSVLAGLIGGGAMEDAGLYTRNAPIYAIPGVGEKLANEAASYGITSIKDLKNNPGWLEANVPAKKLEAALKVYNEVYGGDNPAAVKKQPANNSNPVSE